MTWASNPSFDMATLLARFLQADGCPLDRPITVVRRYAPLLQGAVLVTGADLSLTPDGSGMVSVELASGWYYLTTPWDRPIEFSVPEGGGTHTLDELVGAGVRMNPGFGSGTSPEFAFREGRLWLMDQTSRTLYCLSLGESPGFPVQMGAVAPDASDSPKVRSRDGVLQLSDPNGGWHSLWLGGNAAMPLLRVGDATTVATQRFRFSTTQLQLPNVDALNPQTGQPTFHTLLLIGTPGGLSLAFGPNLLP